ncbi:MAG: hypothetical protein RL330_1206 [Actinomycetota bacterium]
MSIEPALLSILACPEDKGPLHWIADESILYNVRTHRAYRVVDGIPVMLVGESTVLDETEHARLTARIATEGIKPTF